MKRRTAVLLLAFAALVVGPAELVAVPFFQVQATATETRVLTPIDVARLQSVGQVAIRPDGSVIAYTLSVPREPGRDPNGPARTRLHVVSSDGSDDRTFVGGEVNVSHLRWSPDGRFLSYLARRPGQVGEGAGDGPGQGDGDEEGQEDAGAGNEKDLAPERV